jgi:hypothetical protein
MSHQYGPEPFPGPYLIQLFRLSERAQSALRRLFETGLFAAILIQSPTLSAMALKELMRLGEAGNNKPSSALLKVVRSSGSCAHSSGRSRRLRFCSQSKGYRRAFHRSGCAFGLVLAQRVLCAATRGRSIQTRVRLQDMRLHFFRSLRYSQARSRSRNRTYPKGHLLVCCPCRRSESSRSGRPSDCAIYACGLWSCRGRSRCI